MKKFLLLLFIVNAYCAAAQTTNYQVYALYVVNIAKYSAWPNVTNELHVAVFGKSKIFDELVKHNGKVVNGHTLKIQQVEDYSTLPSPPHILYVSDGKSSSVDDIIKHTEGKAVMIVAEREGMFKKGAGFSFVIMENNTLKFDINASELEKRQIRVSKTLASLANSSM